MNLDAEEYCYVTTKGRRTGKPHTIEIWFCMRERTAYILAGDGERSETGRNLHADPDVVGQNGEQTWGARARGGGEQEEKTFVRTMLPAKYAHREDGLELWARYPSPST